ncbi:hypothetical protein FD754_006292, partial [Muntiacus muntjak]
KIFKKGVIGDYRVKMTPRKLCNYCELNWPSFDVGWLPEGTLDLPTVQAVHQVITGTLGHPDQFPYIDSCLLIVQTLPPWARFCTNTQEQKGEKPTFQGDPVEDPLLLLPFVPLTPQAPAQSARQSTHPLPDSPPCSMFPEPTHEQDSSPKPATARQMLLQKIQGPQQVKEDSSPFSTAGLLNWKHNNPLRISTEAQKWLRGQDPTEVLNVEGWAREAMPEMRPNWDFNTREGQ